MPVEEQVIVIFAGTSGYLDAVPVTDVKRYETELLDWFRSRHGDVLDEIRTSGGLPDAVETGVRAFTEQFRTSEGRSGLATPEAEEQGDLQVDMARDEALLPEAELRRDEEG
jgi:F-type H+-transporting ATPase subunit alpha